MKRKIVLLLICFFGSKASAQLNWEFTPQIEQNEYYLLSGKIDDKYSIEMYLTKTWEFCGESDNDRWNARGLRGWYQYEKVKKKIPLIGSMKYDNPEYFVKLYVPKNPLDTIDKKTCNVKEFKEIFIAENCCSLNEMKWRLVDNNGFLPVNLVEKHSFSWTTKAVIKLKIRGIEYADISLTSLTGIEYIQSIEILSAKAVDDKFYAIIQFGHRTNPGSSGSGICGAGFEIFLGHIVMNQSFELENFKYFQIESCLNYIPENLYYYDEKNPEKGINENK